MVMRQETYKLQHRRAFDPNVRKLDGAVKRLEKKVVAGMNYFITQPVYSKEKLKKYMRRRNILMSLYL